MAQGSGVLIYDGECALCVTCVGWITRHWAANSSITAVRSDEWSHGERSVTLTRTELDRAVWWVDGDRRYEGARAISQALRRVPGAWSLVGRLLDVAPFSWIASRVYRVIAERRRCQADKSATGSAPSTNHGARA